MRLLFLFTAEKQDENQPDEKEYRQKVWSDLVLIPLKPNHFFISFFFVQLNFPLPFLCYFKLSTAKIFQISWKDFSADVL